jgi:uncharacterized protein
VTAGASLEGEHFPRQVIINAYGNGGFRFADMSHRGSILCLAEGMYAWPVTGPAGLDAQSFAPLLASVSALGPAPGVVLIGMGDDVAPLPVAIATRLRETGAIVEVLPTGGALRTYNVLLAENRSVAAALIAVDAPRDRHGRKKR